MLYKSKKKVRVPKRRTLRRKSYLPGSNATEKKDSKTEAKKKASPKKDEDEKKFEEEYEKLRKEFLEEQPKLFKKKFEDMYEDKYNQVKRIELFIDDEDSVFNKLEKVFKSIKESKKLDTKEKIKQIGNVDKAFRKKLKTLLEAKRDKFNISTIWDSEKEKWIDVEQKEGIRKKTLKEIHTSLDNFIKRNY